jgi:transcriptional regulator with XRE-family HTH domain
VAEETKISYSHLSRIENDSTVPNPDTVVKIAAALDGDLKRMLELADCLPHAILERIQAREQTAEPSSLRRTAHRRDNPEPLGTSLSDLDLATGLAQEEVDDIMAAMKQLIRMRPHARRAVVEMIRSLEEEDDQPG